MYQGLFHLEQKSIVHHIIHQDSKLFKWIFFFITSFKCLTSFTAPICIGKDCPWWWYAVPSSILFLAVGYCSQSLTLFPIRRFCWPCRCLIAGPITAPSYTYQCYVLSYCIGNHPSFDHHKISQRIMATNYYLRCIFHNNINKQSRKKQWKETNKQRVVKTFKLHRNAYQNGCRLIPHPLPYNPHRGCCRCCRVFRRVIGVICLGMMMFVIWIQIKNVIAAASLSIFYFIFWVIYWKLCCIFSQMYMCIIWM